MGVIPVSGNDPYFKAAQAEMEDKGLRRGGDWIRSSTGRAPARCIG